MPKLSELLSTDAPSTPLNPPLLPLVRKGSSSRPPLVKSRDLQKKVEKTFDELKKTATPVSAIRRPASSTPEAAKPPETKRLREEDIEGFKELLAEQKRRSELAAEQGEENTATYDAAADVGLDDWDEEDEEEEPDTITAVCYLNQLLRTSSVVHHVRCIYFAEYEK